MISASLLRSQRLSIAVLMLISFKQLSSIAALFIISACTASPDFQRPPVPLVRQYDAQLPQKTMATLTQGGAAQTFMYGQDIPASWWTLFRSPPLNALITQAIRNNPDLQAAEATMRQAQETALAAGGSLWPQVNGRAGIGRNKIADVNGGGTYMLYNASVDVSYDLDLWGANKRRVESVEAQADIQRYEMEAAYLSLTANVVTAAMQEASLRAQLEATVQIVNDDRKRYDVLEKQFTMGGIARDALLEQASTIAQSETALAPLHQQLARTRNLLTNLIGAYPGSPLPAQFDFNTIALPETIPVSLPSKLVEQRPDIRAAEAAMHAAAAASGVAAANKLPQINLSASFGTQATDLTNLFSPGTLAWNVGSGLLQPIFRAGELEHSSNAAIAAHEAAAARYRSVVLNAFREVADALRALQADAESLKAQDAAVNAAIARRDQADRQFQMGAGSHLSVLTAIQAYEATRIARVQAQARRYADTAALFQALGGGWWNRVEPIPRAPTVPQQYGLIQNGQPRAY